MQMEEGGTYLATSAPRRWHVSVSGRVTPQACHFLEEGFPGWPNNCNGSFQRSELVPKMAMDKGTPGATKRHMGENPKMLKKRRAHLSTADLG